MAVPLLASQSEVDTDRHPLLMERHVNSSREHVVDIGGGATVGSTSTSNRDDQLPSAPDSNPHSASVSPLASRSINASTARRGGNFGRRSPLNSGFWIAVELVINVSQIIAAIVVLSVSRNEHPRAPLFPWVIGYTVGCFATLPHLFWRYTHMSILDIEPDMTRAGGNSSQNSNAEPVSYTSIAVNQTAEENHRPSSYRLFRRRLTISTLRLNALVDHFKMGLDCFFAVWFVVGNIWVFGGHSSAADAPYLYRLCIAFLAFSCIGYAMPFILCATICCCLPCIISILGDGEDANPTRGATTETIDSLPTYKFRSKRALVGDQSDTNTEGLGEGGIVAAGTNKEKILSAEDAVCCICLAKYADDDDLRELLCSHFFHMECVDKWLKINALCPLCKSEIGGADAVSDANPGRLHPERRVANGAAISAEAR